MFHFKEKGTECKIRKYRAARRKKKKGVVINLRPLRLTIDDFQCNNVI